MPGKSTMVLDFVNDGEEILAAFKPYFEEASLFATTDPNLIHKEAKASVKAQKAYAKATRLTLPHIIVGSAALLVSALSLLLVALGALPEYILAVLYGADVFLGTYVLAGILSLWRMDRRDEARDARLRALRESDARKQRSGPNGHTAHDDR